MSTHKLPNKEICEWSEANLQKHFLQLCEIVAAPKYVCKKCGRVANRKKWLCKVKKLAASPKSAP